MVAPGPSLLGAVHMLLGWTPSHGGYTSLSCLDRLVTLLACQSQWRQQSRHWGLRLRLGPLVVLMPLGECRGSCRQLGTSASPIRCIGGPWESLTRLRPHSVDGRGNGWSCCKAGVSGPILDEAEGWAILGRAGCHQLLYLVESCLLGSTAFNEIRGPHQRDHADGSYFHIGPGCGTGYQYCGAGLGIMPSDGCQVRNCHGMPTNSYGRSSCRLPKGRRQLVVRCFPDEGNPEKATSQG